MFVTVLGGFRQCEHGTGDPAAPVDLLALRSPRSERSSKEVTVFFFRKDFVVE